MDRFKTWVHPEFRERADGLVELFSRYDLPVDVERSGYPNMSLDEILRVGASLTIIGPATAFLAAFASKAGEGAWVKLAKFLKDHQERTPPKEKRYRELVLIRDPETRLGILLSDELPEIALVELYHLDLTAVTGNPKNAFAWRPSSQSWRPETYPAWRTDVYGWYEGPPMHPTPSPLWHLTQFPEVWPIVTLCKQVLDNPRYAPRLGGGQCQRCMVVQGIVATGHVPDWWDETNADWKSGPGRRPSSP